MEPQSSGLGGGAFLNYYDARSGRIIIYDGREHISLASLPEMRDRTVTISGLSKTFSCTGWRLGYAVWPGKLYDYARKLAVNLHSCVNASAQYAGLAALQGPQDEAYKMVAEFDRRLLCLGKRGKGVERGREHRPPASGGR